MAFRNELIPPLRTETSGFFEHTQRVLRNLVPMCSQWTVDRDREMALLKHKLKHEIEDANTCLWSFVDRKGCYTFTTEQVATVKISKEEIAITQRLIGFRGGERYSQPDGDTLARIGEALQEYKDYGVLSDFQRCRLRLIDTPRTEQSYIGRLVQRLLGRRSDA
jgi:hypothetical protein